MKDENYSLKIFETKKFIYYASNDGQVYKIENTEKISGKSQRYYLKPWLNSSGDALRLKICGRETLLKTLIAKNFLAREYQKGDTIKHKDNNIWNCSADNLILIRKSKYAKKTGPMARSRAVIIEENGTKKTYRSVRSAAKALFVSGQTLHDYLKKKRKNSVINQDNKLKIYYAE